jgi:hypothetical protein
LEIFGGCLASIDNKCHFGRENKWNTISKNKSIGQPFCMSAPFEAGGHLPIAHVFAKINVENVAICGHQNVVIMSITNSQHISGHTPTGT